MAKQLPLIILAFACALQSTAGLTTNVQPPEKYLRNCSCLNWREAYEKHGVKCGQGLERYADSMNLEVFRIAAYPTDVTADDYSNREICHHLFRRMNFNYAMNMRIAPMEMPDVYPKIKVALRELQFPKTWCYVKATHTCSMPHGHHVPGTDVSVKVVEEGEDTPLRDLPMDKILELAKTNVLDLATLLPNACHIMLPNNKYDANNVTDEDLEFVKATGRPTMLMTNDVGKVRLYVHGNKVVRFVPGWPHGSVPLDPVMPLQ